MDDWGIFWCIKVTWTLENLNDRNFKDKLLKTVSCCKFI